LMAGTGPLEADVADLIEKTGAPVELLGHRADIAELFNEAWCLILFSDSEFVPLTVQEAMWTGRPVVASPLAGTRWLIGDDQLLPGNMTDAVAALQLLCDPARAAALGDAAAMRIRELLRADDPWPRIKEAYG